MNIKPFVIILVGGKSSRFSSNLSIEKDFIPKSLSIINGKSILMNIIENFTKHGFTKFVLPLGHYKKNFLEILKKEAKKNIKIILKKNNIEFLNNELEIYLVNTNKQDNKATRILKCLKLFNKQDFIVTYGDALGNVNFGKMHKIFKKSSKKCLAASYNISSQYGHFLSIKNKIFYKEKPVLNDPINIGYFFFKKNAIDAFIKYNHLDLENGIIKKLSIISQIEIYLHKGFWKSMDTFKEYEELKRIYESK